MSITYTAKFGLPQWGASTDTGPNRIEFNALLAALEARAAWDNQGTARPTPGTAGRYYWNTVTKELSRDNGTTWDVIAQFGADRTLSNSAITTVPLQLSAIAGTTADAFQVAEVSALWATKISGNGVLSVVDTANKSTVSLGIELSPLLVALSSVNAAAGGVVINAVAAYAGSLLLDLQSDGASKASISKTGKIFSGDMVQVNSGSITLLDLSASGTSKLNVSNAGTVTTSGDVAAAGRVYGSVVDAETTLTNTTRVLYVLNKTIAAGLPGGDTTGAQYVFQADASGNVKAKTFNGLHVEASYANESDFLANTSGAAIGTTAYLTNPTYGPAGMFVYSAAGVVTPVASGMWLGQAYGSGFFGLSTNPNVFIPIRDCAITITLTSKRALLVSTYVRCYSGNTADMSVQHWPCTIAGASTPAASATLSWDTIGTHSQLWVPGSSGAGGSGAAQQMSAVRVLNAGTYTFFPTAERVAGGAANNNDTAGQGYTKVMDAGPA